MKNFLTLPYGGPEFTIITVPFDLQSLSHHLSLVAYIFFPLSTVAQWKCHLNKTVCPLRKLCLLLNKATYHFTSTDDLKTSKMCFLIITVPHAEYMVKFKMFLPIFKATDNISIFEYRHFKIACQPRAITAASVQLTWKYLV